MCEENPNVQGGDTKHVAAVAGGKLWHAELNTTGPSFSAWEQIAPAVTSSPDCAVLRDGSVHVVALGASGNVIEAKGKTGTSWTVTDLKVY